MPFTQGRQRTETYPCFYQGGWGACSCSCISSWEALRVAYCTKKTWYLDKFRNCRYPYEQNPLIIWHLSVFYFMRRFPHMKGVIPWLSFCSQLTRSSSVGQCGIMCHPAHYECSTWGPRGQWNTKAHWACFGKTYWVVTSWTITCFPSSRFLQSSHKNTNLLFQNYLSCAYRDS